jgi:hypothetical protein
METEVRRHLQRAGHRTGDAALVTALADAAAATGLPARDLADRYDAYLLNRCVCSLVCDCWRARLIDVVRIQTGSFSKTQALSSLLPAPFNPTPKTSPLTTTPNPQHSGLEGGKMSATVVDAFVAGLQREAARGAIGAPSAAAAAAAQPPNPATTSPAALPASKWATRSWEELPDNFAGAAPANKDQQWPRAPSSSQQPQLLPGSPLAAGGVPASPQRLVAAAMTPGGPALAAAMASPAPQTAFKQRTNAGQVVSGLNVGGGGSGNNDSTGGLPELAAAAAASRQRYQRMLRESKQQQQQADDAQDVEERTAAASAVVLSAPPAPSSASSSSSAAAAAAAPNTTSSLLLPARGHRYMMERIEDKVAAVDGRINAFERALRAALRSAGHAELAGAELAAVGAPYVDDGEDEQGGGLFVGRVVSDAAGAGMPGVAPAAAPPPLNAASLLLEGGVASSDGARARLVLTPAATAGPAAVRLFPGQVVGVRGFSPEGHTIFARQVYTHVPPVPRRRGMAAGGAAGAGDAAAGAEVGAAATTAAAAEGQEAAAPMDLDAMVAAAGPGVPLDGEEKKDGADEAAAKQQQEAAATAAAAAQAERRAAAKRALRTLPPSLSIVAAAGPLTCSDDLTYDPLTALLEALRPNPPDLLLLLGPFVDAEHPRVADGLCPCPLDALLSDGVAARLASWRASLPQPHRTALRVALVPSVRDAPAHPTFPQPPLDLPGAVALPPAAGAGGGGAAAARPGGQQRGAAAAAAASPDAPLALQNPCTFVVSPAADARSSSNGNNNAGGLLIAATSQDVLRHLAGSELALGGAAGGGGVDRLTALASHLLGQRHLYPLFPAHASACLDTSGDALLRLRARPDLLLLPSDLAPFARRVPPVGPGGGGGVVVRQAAGEGDDDVLCVNPGRLAKGAGGGTYARIVVVGGAGTSEEQQQRAAAALPLADRARVEIVRV